jgi:predicted nucleic acid-binding protein
VSVFVDTSAFYAVMVRTEEGHDRALKAFQKLVEGGRALSTTSYVLLETAALLQHRLGLAPVHDFDSHILPLLTVHWVAAELHKRGMKRLARENRRKLSLVDCVSFELMASEGLRDVFALDGHFADAGFRLIPARS